MFLPQAAIDRIRAAIAERVSPLPSCALCRHNDWRLTDGILAPPIVPNLGVPPHSQPQLRQLTLAAISCGHCGNTMWLNLEYLGLNDLLMELGANLIEDHLDV
jgi:hypothetical protein